VSGGVTSWEPRLFGAVHGEATMTLGDHRAVHGPLPDLAAPRRRRRDGLIELVEASGLRGRGGAGFPAAVKLGAVAAARGPSVVVANGSEGEPASSKDALLLAARPHLVLDGAVLCARAVGAPDVVVAVSGGAAMRSVERALSERTAAAAGDDVAITVARVPHAFIAGEESALLAYLGGGELRPLLRPPHPAERGLRRRPTLVANVETLAHIALIARYGADWFRAVGAADDPGTALVTLSGAVAAAGVFECPSGIALSELIWAAGGVTEPVGAVLVGGYFGEWVDWRDVDGLRLANGATAPGSVRRGAGVVAVLPAAACGPAETARVMAYLAGQSAGQCGPCSNGLPAIAATLARLVDGSPGPNAFADLRRWQAVVPGRGACRLPDGAVRLAASALAVFADEFDDHARHGRCAGCDAPGLLPTPRDEGALAR
jgi:NADH:ubiquinone oxidoreductase subunit F (NADH-binding)